MLTYFKATSKIVDEIAIVENETWQTLGGVVTSIGFFVPDLATVVGRAVMQVKSIGSGAELRIVENNGTADVLMSEALSVGDTQGAWQFKKITTIQTPRDGDCAFRLEGRLNGATSASVRFASLTLLELLPEPPPA